MSQIVSASEIGEHVSTIKTWNPSRSEKQELFEYIDLSSIDQQKKVIVNTSKILPQEAPSRARQLVQKGDVLVSTVRPNLNGVAYVSEQLDGATASTGFCVLRPRRKSLDGRYLFHWVQTSHFVNEMVKLATGANYPAISDRTVKTSKIPLPPLAEQKRIAAILDKADAIRRKRQAAIKLAGDFLRATFLDMFGDPVTNPKGWEVGRLNQICTKITDGEHLNPKFIDDGIPMVMANNVREEGVVFQGVKYVSRTDFARFTKKCKPEKGDILIVSRGATIGRCTTVETDIPFCLMGSVILLKINGNQVNSSFVNGLLQHPGYQAKLYKTSSASAQQAIYLSHLKDISLPIPPLKQQQKFSDIVANTQKIKKHYLLSISKGRVLFNSLTQRAFRGEL